MLMYRSTYVVNTQIIDPIFEVKNIIDMGISLNTRLTFKVYRDR